MIVPMPKAEYVCPRCKKLFYRGKNRSKVYKFCSRTCANVWRNDTKAPLTDEEKIANSKRYWKRKFADPNFMENRRNLNQKAHRRIRVAAMMAYGGLSCSCNHHGEPCGPHPVEFLSIDHIGGDGKKNGDKGGLPLCRKLRRLGYPTGYRVLCHNCNSALGFYGHCPMSDTEIQQRWKTSPGNKKVRVQNQRQQ